MKSVQKFKQSNLILHIEYSAESKINEVIDLWSFCTKEYDKHFISIEGTKAEEIIADIPQKVGLKEMYVSGSTGLNFQNLVDPSTSKYFNLDNEGPKGIENPSEND